MGKRSENCVADSMLALSESSSLGSLSTAEAGEFEGFALVLSPEALEKIEQLERCSILAEHRLGEFRVG